MKGMRVKFVLLILLSILQLCPFIIDSTQLTQSSSSRDSFFTSSDSGDVVVDGINYYVLLDDFHMHIVYSDGSGTSYQMVKTTREAGYDFVAITDHGTTLGALEASQEVEKNGIQIIIIIGEEVTTDWGHLLALDINQVVSGLVNETFKEIHDQGGYAVPAHPLIYWNETVFRSLVESYQVDAY